MSCQSRAGFEGQFAMEPGSGGAPVTLDGRWRHAEDVRSCFDRESAERAKLDDPGQRRVDPLQASKRVIQHEDGNFVWRGDVFRFIDGHTPLAVAPLDRGVTTGVIDQDPPHDLCGDAKEVCAILPVDLALIDEPQVDLVNERRWLQGVVSTLAPELTRGGPAELSVDEREQQIERSPVAATPIAE
jgi:hypothetical protein